MSQLMEMERTAATAAPGQGAGDADIRMLVTIGDTPAVCAGFNFLRYQNVDNAALQGETQTDSEGSSQSLVLKVCKTENEFMGELQASIGGSGAYSGVDFGGSASIVSKTKMSETSTILLGYSIVSTKKVTLKPSTLSFTEAAQRLLRDASTFPNFVRDYGNYYVSSRIEGASVFLVFHYTSTTKETQAQFESALKGAVEGAGSLEAKLKAGLKAGSKNTTLELKIYQNGGPHKPPNTEGKGSAVDEQALINWVMGFADNVQDSTQPIEVIYRSYSKLPQDLFPKKSDFYDEVLKYQRRVDGMTRAATDCLPLQMKADWALSNADILALSKEDLESLQKVKPDIDGTLSEIWATITTTANYTRLPEATPYEKKAEEYEAVVAPIVLKVRPPTSIKTGQPIKLWCKNRSYLGKAEWWKSLQDYFAMLDGANPVKHKLISPGLPNGKPIEHGMTVLIESTEAGLGEKKYLGQYWNRPNGILPPEVLQEDTTYYYELNAPYKKFYREWIIEKADRTTSDEIVSGTKVYLRNKQTQKRLHDNKQKYLSIGGADKAFLWVVEA